jgi:hypothetical protein
MSLEAMNVVIAGMTRNMDEVINSMSNTYMMRMNGAHCKDVSDNHKKTLEYVAELNAYLKRTMKLVADENKLYVRSRAKKWQARKANPNPDNSDVSDDDSVHTKIAVGDLAPEKKKRVYKKKAQTEEPEPGTVPAAPEKKKRAPKKKAAAAAEEPVADTEPTYADVAVEKKKRVSKKKAAAAAEEPVVASDAEPAATVEKKKRASKKKAAAAEAAVPEPVPLPEDEPEAVIAEEEEALEELEIEVYVDNEMVIIQEEPQGEAVEVEDKSKTTVADVLAVVAAPKNTKKAKK